MKFLDIMKHCLTILVSFAAASFLTAAEESRAMVIIAVSYTHLTPADD